MFEVGPLKNLRTDLGFHEVLDNKKGQKNIVEVGSFYPPRLTLGEAGCPRPGLHVIKTRLLRKARNDKRNYFEVQLEDRPRFPDRTFEGPTS